MTSSFVVQNDGLNEETVDLATYLESERLSIATDLENVWTQMQNICSREDLIDPESEDWAGVDARLRVHDGNWEVLWGDSSMDTDHRGYWGYGSLCYDIEPEDLTQEMLNLAKELIEGVLDQEAMSRQ
jgi:3',5'-cyclic AMP phosphodiesterase CpdA